MCESEDNCMFPEAFLGSNPSKFVEEKCFKRSNLYVFKDHFDHCFWHNQPMLIHVDLTLAFPRNTTVS